MSEFEGFETRCPGCKQDAVEELEDLGVSFLGCTQCFGLFTNEANLERYVQVSSGSLEVGEGFRDLLGRSLDEKLPIPGKRPCPVCKAGLGRIGFGEAPFVILDRCPHHGIWLDKKELKKVIRSARAHARVLGLIEYEDEEV